MSMMVGMARVSKLGEVLYVPVEGVLQVFQHEVDPVSLLNDPGRYALLHIGKDAHVHFRVNEGAGLNLRASAVLVMLTEVNWMFTGPVVFTGLTGERIYEVIQQLNKEGTG